MANTKNLKPFKKGDPRINRNGRPKSFDKLRKLAKQIANETAIDRNTGQPVVINNHLVTKIEAMMRQLMIKDPKLFLEYAYGKPKQVLEMEGEMNVNVQWDNADDNN